MGWIHAIKFFIKSLVLTYLFIAIYCATADVEWNIKSFIILVIIPIAFCAVGAFCHCSEEILNIKKGKKDDKKG